MEKRYTALRAIGTFYKVLGGLAAVVTVLAVLAICLGAVLGSGVLGGLGREFGVNVPMGRMGGAFEGLIVGFFALLYGAGVAVTLFGIGELIYLLLAVEENTRVTAHLLRQGSASPKAPALE
ncbi:MAG: hypothetical protein GX605_03310 [Chloroflexi bacterium]|nr:hypothetical protein [Chloroflexota bacterium]